MHLNRRRGWFRSAIFSPGAEDGFHPDNRAWDHWSFGYMFAHTVGFVERNQLADPMSMVIGTIIIPLYRLVAYGPARDPAAANPLKRHASPTARATMPKSWRRAKKRLRITLRWSKLVLAF
jgi:hypothetical protein